METDKLINQLVESADKVDPIMNPVKKMIIWISVWFIYVTIMVLILDVREDIGTKIKDTMFIGEMLFVAAAAISATLGSICASVPDFYQKHYLKWVGAIPSILILFVLGSIWYVMGEKYNVIEDFAAHCVTDMALFSIFPAGMMIFYMSKGAVTNTRWAGALVGFASANVSYIALRLVEEEDVIQHLFLWHYLPMFFIVPVIINIGKRYFKW